MTAMQLTEQDIERIEREISRLSLTSPWLAQLSVFIMAANATVKEKIKSIRGISYSLDCSSMSELMKKSFFSMSYGTFTDTSLVTLLKQHGISTVMVDGKIWFLTEEDRTMALLLINSQWENYDLYEK